MRDPGTAYATMAPTKPGVFSLGVVSGNDSSAPDERQMKCQHSGSCRNRGSIHNNDDKQFDLDLIDRRTPLMPRT